MVSAAPPIMPPRTTPSIPRLTAVAPMLTNDKDEHQATQLVAGGDEGALFDDMGNAKTYARPGLSALGNGRGPDTDPSGPGATPPQALTGSQIPTAGLGLDLGPQPMFDQRNIPTSAEGFNPAFVTQPGRHTDLSADATIPPQRRMSAARLRPVVDKVRHSAPHVEVVSHPGNLPEDTLPPDLNPAARAIFGIPRGIFLAMAGVLGVAILGTVGAFLFANRPQGMLLIDIPSDTKAPIEVTVNGKPVTGPGGRALAPGDAVGWPTAEGKALVIMKVPGYKTLIDDTIVIQQGEIAHMLSKLEKDNPAP